MDNDSSDVTQDTGLSNTSYILPTAPVKETQLNFECQKEKDPYDFLVVNEVKIFPSKLNFLNTFDGKRYERIIEILNCGSKTAIIRIATPTNTVIQKFEAFQIKSFPLGIRISPGMKIVRKLIYTYQQHNSLYIYNLPIIVNDQYVPFKILISPSMAKISIDTELLDFGLMDVGHSVTRRSFKIKNIGTLPARFSIDLGSNEFQIAVDPIKGVIQSCSENMVHVEISSLDEASIESYIFVNCMGERFTVAVSGTVMVCKLEVANLPTCSSFTIVEFPRTYYGATSTQRLLVRNNSAARTVFCAVYCEGENDGEPFINNLKFSITPLDGRLEPRETRIFTIDYKPTLKNVKESYHFETLVIKKLNYCKDMNVTDYPCTQISYTEYQDLVSNSSLVELESVVKLCLHGEPEIINVACAPDTIILKDMTLNQSVDRIVTLKNNSTYLPIKFVYEKVAFIEVFPKSGILRPSASIDIKIVLTSFKFGRVNTTILWILYNQPSPHGDNNVPATRLGKIHVQVTMEAKVVTTTPDYNINPGITPKYIRECGQYYDNVKYNTKGTIPKLIIDPIKRQERKDDKALIAFPNDRPKTLRVIWNGNNQTVETIYAKLPRVVASTDDYSMNIDDQYLRSLGREFYNKYLKQSRMDQLRTLHKNELPEYELTKLRQFLIFRYFVEGSDVLSTYPSRGMFDGFIPLTPIQLHKVKVVPMRITVGVMASYSKISKSFDIVNNNDKCIRIFIVPDKQRFTFPDGEGTNVHPHSSKTINFNYFSEYEGFHNTIIRIVVNETHIFEITVMVHVVCKKLYINPLHTIFGPNDPSYKFISFYNPLNVNIDYCWIPNESNFVIEPVTGKIPPCKAMTCMITYDPLRNKSNNLDITYTTNLLNKFRYNVRAEPVVISTVLCDDKLDFGFVGCNLTQLKHAFLWNHSKWSVEFNVETPKANMGIQIFPEIGVILPRSCQLISVQLQTVECIAFNYTIPILINSKPTHYLQVQGQVLFPNIKFNPSPIRLKKMPVTSFQKYTVTITNKSKAATHVSFDFQNLMLYPISETKDGERFEQAEFILDPNESKLLYIQLDPTNITSMWYLIPFVFNYILGPPVPQLSLASKPRTYITNAVHKLPDTFSILKIFATIVESDFSISKINFQFVYNPFNDSKNICTASTVFKNNSDKTLEFCIRLDDIRPPFEIEFEAGKPVTPHPFSITMSLEPDESTTLCIRYCPATNSGYSHFCAVPFYVRDDYIDEQHNYLRLKGTYIMPEIVVPKFIYFEFLPLLFKFNKTIRIMAYNHCDDCEIVAESLHVNLHVMIIYISMDLLRKRTEVDISIIYTSQYVEALKSTIQLHCTCGSSAEITCYGVAENSIFTSFRVVKTVPERITFQKSTSRLSLQHLDVMSHIVANERISFPYFPEDLDEDFKFLTETLEMLETWLFCQGFCGRYRYTIPDSFSRVIPIPRNKKSNGLKVNEIEYIYVVPYVELLKLIASNEIAAQFKWNLSTTSTEEDRVYQLYCLYDNIISFLKDLNAFFPHVQPELLMSYDYYTIYKTAIKADRKVLSAKLHYHSYYNFILLSKQAWMDVILQTLKIFILGRVQIPKDPSVLLLLNTPEDHLVDNESAHPTSLDNNYVLTHTASNRSTEFIRLLDNNSENASDFTMLHHIYSNSEYFLLNWISCCFCKSIETICNHKKLEKIKERFVNDFDSCFTDSLLIVTAIVTYCPYLKKYFSNLYWMPSGSEQYHHNAARVVEALTLINSSFELQPCNLYNPINIQMVLFTAYLYEFLPSMYPHTTINVKASLSNTSNVKITILNENDFDISYAISFFQNEHQCFTVTKISLTIKPHQKEILTVKYTARYIRQVKAVLVLCGESLCKRSAKSIVYSLIGEPDVSYVHRSYSFRTRLYTNKEHVMHLNSPYKASACYDMFFCLEPPTSYESLVITDYNDIVKQLFPCCFNYYTSQIVFDDQGEATISITGVALSMCNREVWFYLRNDELGDFLIYVEMSTAPTREVEILNISIPVDIYNRKCVCQEKGKRHCRKFVNINIPKTNFTLLEALRTIFVKMKGDDEEFWSAYIKKTSSIRHMRKMLNGTYNNDMKTFLDLLILDKTYDVLIIGSSDKHSDVTCTPTIDITNLETDYTKEKYTPLTIHVGNKVLSSLVLELRNATHKERRRYKVMFENISMY